MDDFEKRLEKDMKIISDKLDEYELSEEFKEKLAKRMDYEYNKPIHKGFIKNNSVFVKKLVASFACCFVVLSTCVAFGDQFESMIANIFSNTDKTVEQAIENGEYKKINMDYVEDNGISVKVDYVVKTGDSIYFAFNVLADEKCEDLYFDGIEITDEKGDKIFGFDIVQHKFDFYLIKKNISKNNFYMLYNLNGLNNEKINEQILNFHLTNIKLKKVKNSKQINCNINFKINV